MRLCEKMVFNSKIENDLGWKAIENFESGILKTIKWYLTKYEK